MRECCVGCDDLEGRAGGVKPLQQPIEIHTFEGRVVGYIAGFVTAAILFGIVTGFIYARNRDKELVEYAEKQIEIEALREDYGNRDPLEFLDAVPGVRGAADGAAGDFDRKLNEILQRFRNRLAD